MQKGRIIMENTSIISDEELDMEVDIGELSEIGEVASPVSDNSESIILDEHSQKFEGHENTLGEMLEKSKCRVCSKRTAKALLIDDMCMSCARKKMRYIEETLVRFKQLKEPHKWCVLEGHNLAANNPPGLEDWNGHINVNGVDLYPVEPICQNCVNLVTTHIVAYLEERGFLRKGSGHTNNEYGTPYRSKLSVAAREEAIIRLRHYISALDVLVNSKDDALADLHKSLLNTRAVLLKKHISNKETNKDENASES